MGYALTDLTMTKNYVIANGVALLLTYAVLHSLTQVNYLSQIIAMCCYESDTKEQALVL